jgi:hypothetical protein
MRKISALNDFQYVFNGTKFVLDKVDQIFFKALRSFQAVSYVSLDMSC